MCHPRSWPLLGAGFTLGKEDYVSGVLAESCPPSNATVTMLRDVSARARQQGRRLIYECHYKPQDSPNGTTVRHRTKCRPWRVSSYQKT